MEEEDESIRTINPATISEATSALQDGNALVYAVGRTSMEHCDSVLSDFPATIINLKSITPSLTNQRRRRMLKMGLYPFGDIAKKQQSNTN
jgi:hypothetical protein